MNAAAREPATTFITSVGIRKAIKNASLVRSLHDAELALLENGRR